MQKIVSGLLVFILVIGMAGCFSDDDDKKKSEETSTWVEVSVETPDFSDMTWVAITNVNEDESDSTAGSIIVTDIRFTDGTNNAYILNSSGSDGDLSFALWGDVWGTGTTIESVGTNTVKLISGTGWGGNNLAYAWGNDSTNAEIGGEEIDISTYTHFKFKVKTSDFTTLAVHFQSLSEDQVIRFGAVVSE